MLVWRNWRKWFTMTYKDSKQWDYPKIRYASDKAKETEGGHDLYGRITFSQYNYLVEHGYDGDKIRKWTKYHAHQVIEKLKSADEK